MLLCISRTEKIRNEIIKKKMNFEDNITNDFERKKQLLWYSNI